jgi:predicted enzyme related to lactoylglutathione lyase
MATRLVHLVLDAIDPPRIARFWADALEWVVVADETAEEADVWPPGFDYPSPAALPLVIVPVSEPKTGQNLVHLDLASASVEHQEALVRRMRDLGATPANVGQGNVPWVVLADPEGNEFCVLEPRPVYRDTGPVAAVIVDCADPQALTPFWADAAGFAPHGWDGHLSRLRSPTGEGPYLELLHNPREKVVKNRLHLDVAPGLGDDHPAEVARLRKAGATDIDVGQGEVSWAVLADPEGSEFCVLSPR